MDQKKNIENSQNIELQNSQTRSNYLEIERDQNLFTVLSNSNGINYKVG